jgi:hypothetical protein
MKRKRCEPYEALVQAREMAEAELEEDGFSEAVARMRKRNKRKNK